MNTLSGIGFSLAVAASLSAHSNGEPNGNNGEPPPRYTDTKVTFQPGEGLTFDGGDAFGVNLRHVIQPWFSYTNRDGGLPDQTGFDVRRARQDITGHAFHPEVTFRVQLEHQESISAKDLWVNWEFFRQDNLSVSVRLGQQKTRSSLQFNSEGYAQSFTERAIATNTFSNARAQGALFHGRTLEDDMLGFFAGIFNTDIAGASIASNEQGTNTGENELNFIFGAHFDPHGSIGNPESWTEGELSHNGEMKSTIGASIYLGNDQNGANVDVETTQININAGFKLGNGISTQGEVFIRDDDVDGGGSADALGWYAQADYALPYEEGQTQFGAGVRVSMVDFDDAPLLLNNTALGFAGAAGDVFEVNGALNAFYHQHKLKSQIGLTYQQVSPDGGTDQDNFILDYLFTLVF